MSGSEELEDSGWTHIEVKGGSAWSSHLDRRRQCILTVR